MAQPTNAIKGFIEVTFHNSYDPVLIAIHNIAGITGSAGYGPANITVVSPFGRFDSISRVATVKESYQEVVKRIREASQ